MPCGSSNRVLSAKRDARVRDITKHSATRRGEQEKRKSSLWADVFPPQDSAFAGSRGTLPMGNHDDRAAYCSMSLFRQRSATEWSRRSSRFARVLSHGRGEKPSLKTREVQLTYRHRQTGHQTAVNPKHQQVRWLWMGRLDGTKRIASERPRHMARARMTMSSHQSCPTAPTRTRDSTIQSIHPSIPSHPFTRPFIAWDTQRCAINAPCVARNKCTLRLCSKSNPPYIQYAVHSHSTFLAWLACAVISLIPTYYEIGRDGEGTHQHGVAFRVAPSVCSFPSCTCSESVSQLARAVEEAAW